MNSNSNLDVSLFWCWQKDCPDFGKKGAGNIVLKERYGKDNRALLKCRTCGHCFSETHGMYPPIRIWPLTPIRFWSTLKRL